MMINIVINLKRKKTFIGKLSYWAFSTCISLCVFNVPVPENITQFFIEHAHDVEFTQDLKGGEK